MYLWVSGDIKVNSVEQVGNTFIFYLDGGNKVTIEINDWEKGKGIVDAISEYADPKNKVKVGWV